MSGTIQTQGPQLQVVAKQNLQFKQHLMMSAQMQQAISMLQLPLQELDTFIEEQIVQNPLLEIISEEEKN